jgi:hypothetical protein
VSESIPIIDIGDFLAGRPGKSGRALAAAARQVHEALTTTGFFVLTGHGVPQPLIARTFAEARRFHQLPLEKKLALKLNEHINGYMVMGRYAVRTSDINNNDKGDLNEAFFIKRERPPDDPLLLSGRRFVGANLWPAESDLPGFRANVLDYVAVMDDFARRFLPVVAVALELSPDLVRRGLHRQPVHLSPVALPAGRGRGQPVRHRPPYRQQLHDLPGADRGAGATGQDAVGELARRPVCAGLLRGQFRRHGAALDQRPFPVDAAPRLAARGPRPLRDPVLPRAALRPGHRMPAELHRPR